MKGSDYLVQRTNQTAITRRVFTFPHQALVADKQPIDSITKTDNMGITFQNLGKRLTILIFHHHHHQLCLSALACDSVLDI